MKPSLPLKTPRSPRILIINYEYPPIGGGAATFARNLALGLSYRKYPISVATSRHGRLPRLEIDGGKTTLYRIPTYRKSLCECSVFGMIVFLFSGLFHIDRIVQQTRPDLCLNFFSIPCGPIALYIKKKYGIPYVLCLRGTDVPGTGDPRTERYHRLLSPLTRQIWKEAAAIAANSHGLKGQAETFFKPKPIQVVFNGIDPKEWGPKRGAHRSTDTFNVLYVGRLSPEKNLMNLLEKVIFPALERDIRHRIRVHIVGDGPLRRKLMDRAEGKNFLNRIDFTGWMPREEMPHIYSANDLLLLPSLNEGMSNVVLEAKASGLPVAGFAISGNTDIFERGRDILVGTGDYETLTRKILAAAGNGKNGKRAVSRTFAKKFSLHRIIDQYEGLIRQAAGQ